MVSLTKSEQQQRKEYFSPTNSANPLNSIIWISQDCFQRALSHENDRRDGFALHTQSKDWRVVGSTTAVDFYKTRTKICNAGKIVTSIAASASSNAIQSNVSLCRAFLEVKDRSRWWLFSLQQPKRRPLEFKVKSVWCCCSTSPGRSIYSPPEIFISSPSNCRREWPSRLEQWTRAEPIPYIPSEPGNSFANFVNTKQQAIWAGATRTPILLFPTL